MSSPLSPNNTHKDTPKPPFYDLTSPRHDQLSQKEKEITKTVKQRLDFSEKQPTSEKSPKKRTYSH